MCPCKLNKYNELVANLISQGVYSSAEQVQRPIIEEFERINPCTCKEQAEATLKTKLVTAGLYASTDEVSPIVVDAILGA